MNFHTVLYSFLLILPEWTHQYQLSRQTLIPSLNFVLVFVLDQAKQQRLEEARSLDEANFSTFELRQSRRGTMKSNRTTTIDRNTVDRDPSGHRERDRDSRGIYIWILHTDTKLYIVWKSWTFYATQFLREVKVRV